MLKELLFLKSKLIQMGLNKVIGAILIVMSTSVGITGLFVFLNSSAFFDYNTGESARFLERLNTNGLLIPLLICGLAFVLGYFLTKDRVLDAQ
ncbi:MAG: hypothetical protein GY751_23400 [Bacteroidetes bacterium]|nr:hypothetical protein [Bacteroidota bacterium]